MITNVLIVDDDVAICRIVQRMLADEQYQIQTSHSVAEALGSIQQQSFNAYVLDYKLPDGSGLDVAERIRSKGDAAPIILISGYEASSVALRAQEFRISDFLEKPFSREIICNALKKAIGPPLPPPTAESQGSKASRSGAFSALKHFAEDLIKRKGSRN
jgi:two-component system response regulator HydG